MKIPMTTPKSKILVAITGLLVGTSAHAATLMTDSFTQPGFENGGDAENMNGDYLSAATNTISLVTTNAGKWILGNTDGANNAYDLDDTDTPGNTSIYLNTSNSALRGFVQHLDAGASKWTGSATLSIDYVGDGSGSGDNHFFTFVVFAWNDSDAAPTFDIHGNGSVLYKDDIYNGLNSVFSVLPTTYMETPIAISTDLTASNPWQTAQVSLNLGETGYDNFGVMIASDGDSMLFDNLQVIPEPSSAILLGLSGMSLLFRRRR